MRRIVFGDPHANYLGIESILAEIHYNSVDDIIVFVGDYCDHFTEHKTRDARKTVDLLIKLQKKAPDTTFFIFGNHDEWFRDWINQGGIPEEIWWFQGGWQTLSSYAPKEALDGKYLPKTFHLDEYAIEALRKKHIPETHKQFFRNLPLYYIDDEMVCVHGGFPIDITDRHIVLNMMLLGRKIKDPHHRRQMLWDRTFWQGYAMALQIFREYFDNRYLITGHTQCTTSGMYQEVTDGPFVHHKNKKWINIDSSGLHAIVIDGNDYKIVGQSEEWEVD